MRAPARRVLIATFGSLGDLHPYLALALALRDRGHRPAIATHASHRVKVEAEGLPFFAVRPDPADWGSDPQAMRRAWHPIDGPRFLLKEVVLAHVEDSHADLDAAVQAHGAQLLLSHPMTFSIPMIAQARGLPWLSTVLAPGMLPSAHDPLALPFAPWLLDALGRVPAVGPRLVGATLRGLRRAVRPWAQPLHAMRARLGLPSTTRDLLVDGQFSPLGTLALFSRTMARPQPDWPAHVRITGFPFYDKPGDDPGVGGLFDAPDGRDLDAFLDAGAPPIAFTLGSAAVLDARDFWSHAITATRALGRRAVLLVGPGGRQRLPSPLPRGIAAFEYAPHSLLFPRSCAVVHQGGIGTTGQAMRAGVPQLVVPFGFDQPDNARRMARLGVAHVLARNRWDGARATSALERLFADRFAPVRAFDLAAHVRAEPGASAACDAIERLLAAEGPQAHPTAGALAIAGDP